ncbi:MAG: PEP-CTERM sorting domain-containing protein [Aquabacterium sp.]|nr:PEP-CTERM sorting domain-containing protein [Aquabacterium sp.]
MNALRHVAIAALFAVSAAHGAQTLVVNGSLTDSIENNGVPSGWINLEGTPDVLDALNNVGLANEQHFGAAPSASPDGGTWVGLGSDAGYTERFGQVLSGLTVGQQYTVSWSAGNFGYNFGTNNYLGQNAIDVMIDGQSIGKGATLALGSNWFNQSLTFAATSASQQISFKLATSTKAYLSIDGIAVNATAPVPEPGTWALMGLGLCAVGFMRKRRQA